jgi:hypothetical protein
LSPQFIGNDEIGYLSNTDPNEGLAYTSNRAAALKRRFIRSPCWSPDGKP